MDHIKVIKQAWDTTWRYKALWVFGILLALTSGGGGGGGGGGGSGNTGAQFNGGGGEWNLPGLPELPAISTGIIVAAIVALCSFILLATVLTVITRYVSETALLRMVDDHEETGEQRTVKQGFRLGWSRGAWRLFLLDLLVGLVVGAVMILMFLLAASPLLVWITEVTALRVIGTVAAIGFFILAILVAIVVGTVINTLLHFVRRVVILEGKGIFEALREGGAFVRAHLKDVALMWLLMFGIRLAFTLVMIPVLLLLLTLGVVTGGLPALALGGLVSLVSEGALPWIIGGGIGLLIFMIVVGIPSLFVGGIYETFASSTWTLTYRELRALEALEIEAIETPSLPEATTDAI